MLLGLLSAAHAQQPPLLQANNNFPNIVETTYAASADLNGDGVDEVLLTTSSKQGLVIYQVDGSGQITEYEHTPVLGPLNRPNSGIDNPIAVFDVDQDGDQDIWVANVNNVDRLWVNDGQGRFMAQEDFYENTPQLQQIQLVVGDVDNDGDLDLVKSQKNHSNTSVQIYLTFYNQGDGQFLHQFTLQENQDRFTQSHLADFDQDGHLDLWSLGSELHIFLNDQSGHFNPTPLVFDLGFDVFFVGFEPSLPMFIDINQDGHLDIQGFAGNSVFPRAINDGQGGFNLSLPAYGPNTLSDPFDTQSRYEDLSFNQQTAAFVDLNDDGMLDMVASLGGLRDVVALLSDAQGFVDFGSQQFYSTPYVKHILTTDHNQDGRSDLITIGRTAEHVWQQSTDGELLDIEQNRASRMGWSTNMTWQDLNGDGDADLIQTSGMQIKYRLGNGRGGLGPMKNPGLVGRYGMAAGDVNGDGRLDLIGSLANEIWVHLNTGPDQFESHHWSVGDLTVYDLSLSDYDQDGDPDLLVRLQDKALHVLANDGTGHFILQQELYPEYPPSLVQWAAFETLSPGAATSVISIGILGEGRAVNQHRWNGAEFELVKQYFFPGPFSVSVGALPYDADGDSDLDLLVSQADDEVKTFWLINQDNTFEAMDHPYQGPSDILAVADFNLDGQMDLLGTDPSRLYLGQAAGGYTEQNINDINQFMLLLVDLDEDGDVDLISDDQVNGQTSYLNTTIDQDFNGLWYNPLQNGHGIQAHTAVVNGAPQLVAAWYVFRDGQPVWLIGTGAISDQQATLQMTISEGPEFGSAFQSDDLQVTAWGQLTLQLEGNDQMHVNWDGQDVGFSAGNMVMQKLSAIKPVDVMISQGLNSCHTGAWFNPSQNGHGFMVQVNEIEQRPSMVINWYTYVTGQQRWISAAGPIIGDTAELTAISGTGGDFPPNYAAEDVQFDAWGDLTFTLKNDNQAVVSWSPLGSTGLPSGQLEVTRMTAIDRYRCD